MVKRLCKNIALGATAVAVAAFLASVIDAEFANGWGRIVFTFSIITALVAGLSSVERTSTPIV